MDLQLVSFKTCPYVQRSVITLKEKNIPFDITYIDLMDPPAWFKQDSPLGKVPILKTTVNDEAKVLFESAVINEYVDEVTEGSLMPADPWDKAITRAWVEFGGNCNVDYYVAYTAKDQAGYEKARDALKAKLTRLQGQVVGPYFLGEEFTLADAALAPLMMRLEELEKFAPGFDFGEFPELQVYKDLLVARPAVAESMVPEWRELMLSYLANQESYLSAQLTTA
jgi:glutathione S-transferase